MQKIRYEVDPHNRLVVDASGKKSGLTKFRKVLDGQFRIEKDNTLSYHVKTPLTEDRRIPSQIRIRGKWSLTDRHDLCLTLDKSGRETFGDQIVLQGEILDVDEGSLLFAVTTKRDNKSFSTYCLRLEGVWKADDNNRLSFYIKKETGRNDILIFNGAWEIDKKHRIVYYYEKADLIRKKKRVHSLLFKGYWDIKGRTRISYVLSKSTGSVFDLQTSVGIFGEERIVYELCIALTGEEAPVKRVITLTGRWELKKDIGLVFKVEYEKRKVRSIVFGAEAKLTGKDMVAFRLKNDVENKDIGISLELSRKILKGDGEAFLNFLRSSRESSIFAGAAWRW
ncbi:MAG: hypothetical protein WC779_03505 [Candidatus Omnitrophota bacterium]